MAGYSMTAAAKDAFLASATDIAPASTAVSPRIYCGHVCLQLRSGNRFDFNRCNGYLYEDGNCHLGYANPNWIYEQKLNPGTDASLYFDVIFP